MIELMEVIKWPVVVAFSAWLFRHSIAGLIPHTRKVKYKDLEISFSTAQSDADAALPPTPEGATQLAPVEIDLLELAEVSPTLAILESWKEVERSAKNLIRRSTSRDLDFNVPSPYKLIQDTLISTKILEGRQTKVFNDLRLIRNRVAHAEAYNVSPGQARQFIELARRLIAFFDQTHAESGAP